MIIGIDARVLATGRKSGIEEYARQLIPRLIGLDPSVRYKIFFSARSRQLDVFGWRALPNVQTYEFKIPNRVLFYGALFAGQPKPDVMMGGVDVFFSPHFFLAPTGPATRRVITFHDLSYERFPEFFSMRQRLWHSLQMQPRRQARKADAIIAVSDSTKNDIEELYGIDPAKITRIYSGIDPAGARPMEEAISAYRKKKNLPSCYILSLGTLEPRKNILGLIRAFTLMKNSERFTDVQLIIAGAPGWLYKDIFMAAERSGVSSDIRFLSEIGDDERALLYAGASVFVYPSFFEGFGFPPLEAMHCGTPVIASNTSSLPEVLGSAALLIDPYVISDISGAMAAVLDDTTLQNSLAQRGLERAGRFRWETTARQTLELLLQVGRSG